MSKKLRIALAQFDFPVGAVSQNAERISAMIAEARDAHGADLVLFPELAISGYPPEDLLMRPGFLRDCEAALQQIAAATTGIVAVVGWPQSAGSVVYNAASVLRDGAMWKPLTANASCPTTRCSTNAAISMSIRTAAPACSRSPACRSGW